jgi:hypothetical protein
MNLKSEQISNNGQIVIDHDEKISTYQKRQILSNVLGPNNICYEHCLNKKVLIYTSDDGKKTCLLFKSVTYLGGNGQHPIFKKRMQLPTWYKDVTNELLRRNYDVRFIGIYKYMENIIFVEFVKDTYLKRKMNNSAAHVYINDLYQAFTNGMFRKIDSFTNEIVTISYNNFKGYIDNTTSINNELFNFFDNFNSVFPFEENIVAIDAIKEMHLNEWQNWRQAEWAGWYLEYLIQKYIQISNCEDVVKYIGNLNKSVGDLDFDLLFVKESFLGDLKASNMKYNEVILNDQENVIKSLEIFNKFWYVIYNHSTVKDCEYSHDYLATKARNWYIREVDDIDDDHFDEMSYSTRMKYSVNFSNMIIVEINQSNYKHLLRDFNQGRQPNGSTREKKFKLRKSEIDNFVVYRYIKY